MKTYSTDTVKNLINKAGEVLQKSPEECIKYANQALEISTNLDFPLGIGMSLMDIGLGNFYKGNYIEVINYYKEALEIFYNVDYPSATSQMLNNFGALYDKLLDADKALECYLEAIEIDTKIGNKFNLSLTLNNIGNIYYHSGKDEEALLNYQKALDLAEEINYPYGASVALNNIGKIYRKRKEYELALKFLNRSKEICLEIDKTQVLIRTYLLMSDIYGRQKKYDEAVDILIQALNFVEEKDFKEEKIEILAGIASLKIAMGDFENVERMLQNIEEEAIENNFKNQLENIYYQFSGYYEKIYQFKTALDYFKKYHKIHKQLFEERNNDKTALLQTRFEVKSKEKELQLSKQKNAELKKQVEEGIKNWKKQHQLLIQKSKLESLGRLAAGISHEINQPLQAISLGLENIKNKAKMKKLSENYINSKIINFSENVERIKKIINHICVFSREQTSLDVTVFDVNEMIEKALSVTKLSLKKHNINLKFQQFENELTTIGNKYRFEQVIFNLISNARDAVEKKSHPKEITIITKSENNFAIVEVQDNGCGISKENLEKVCTPFFTTKEPEKGTGLGLSIAYGIIKEMDGDIKIQSEKNKFTKVLIFLPLTENKGKEKNERKS